MDSASAIAKPGGDRHPTRQPPLRLLAETVVSVGHTLGTGNEQDNRALDEIERSVWVELRLVCPDRQEREHLIANAHATVAPPGPPACRRAAGLLVRTAGWLLHAAADLGDAERSRLETCAERCAKGAARLERIALQVAGS
jgi:hypothetical protein